MPSNYPCIPNFAPIGWQGESKSTSETVSSHRENFPKPERRSFPPSSVALDENLGLAHQSSRYPHTPQNTLFTLQETTLLEYEKIRRRAIIERECTSRQQKKRLMHKVNAFQVLSSTEKKSFNFPPTQKDELVAQSSDFFFVSPSRKEKLKILTLIANDLAKLRATAHQQISESTTTISQGGSLSNALENTFHRSTASSRHISVSVDGIHLQFDSSNPKETNHSQRAPTCRKFSSEASKDTLEKEEEREKGSQHAYSVLSHAKQDHKTNSGITELDLFQQYYASKHNRVGWVEKVKKNHEGAVFERLPSFLQEAIRNVSQTPSVTQTVCNVKLPTSDKEEYENPFLVSFDESQFFLEQDTILACHSPLKSEIEHDEDYTDGVRFALDQFTHFLTSGLDFEKSIDWMAHHGPNESPPKYLTEEWMAHLLLYQ